MVQQLPGFLGPRVAVFMYPWAFLALTALLAMHVQVATRFLSTCPPLYWYLAHLWLGPAAGAGAAGRPASPAQQGQGRGRGGQGGWGAWLIAGEHHKELCGGEMNTTNNRMDLRAVIEALNALKRPSDIVLHTDSQYVQKGISEWIVGWKKRGWRKADKSPVLNVDLWMALDEARLRHTIEWRWVKGHAGHPGNEKADELANRGVEMALRGAAA